MTPADREGAKELLAQAARLDPALRKPFIESALNASDDAKAEAQELLSTLDDSAFMAAPTGAGFTASSMSMADPEGVPGGRIGRYKLLQALGEGGFGTVFMAEQTEPVHRRVALKIIKAGMDTKQVIARFEAERQALAMMDHPNIARVLDAGATEYGRPYFVMDLVRGEPVTRYCDQELLSIRQRLALFRGVCNAVEHAHQKGIIHRDLKPSNVLVTIADGEPMPKVIDFGIAKATATRLTESTLFTEMHQLIGTPEYMSPEQAEVAGVDIDTRSDIYSLGVLLYELLTGTTPLERDRMRSRPLAEIQRLIKEEEPQRPSLRLAAMRSSGAGSRKPFDQDTDATGSSAIQIAERRRSEPPQLTRALRGDLDWIVMKCLEKDRSRRYATASALAEDVGRYLSDQPVIATPASRRYQLQKFMRRNKVAVFAGIGIAGVLVAATGVSLTFAIREAAARDRERSAMAREIEQRELADQERRRAEAINRFVVNALQTSDPHQGGNQNMLVADAMMRAVEQINDGAFQGDAQTEAELLSTISTILNRNARPADALPLAKQAVDTLRGVFSDDHPEIARALVNQAAVLRTLGRNKDAEPLLREALLIQRGAQDGDHADVATVMMDLATVLRQLGRATEAEPFSRESLAMRQWLFAGDHPDIAASLNNLALLLHALGRAQEAEPFFRQSLEMRQRVFPNDHPDVSQGLNNLASILQVLDRNSEAEPLYREALAMRRRLFKGDHPDIARAMNNLASLLQTLRRNSEAVELYREALAMRRRLFPGDHPDVAQALSNLAYALMGIDAHLEAELLLREALEMRFRVYEGDHPELSVSLVNLADLLAETGREQDAEPLARRALDMSRRLTPADHLDVVLRLDSLACILMYLGQLEEAETLAREALDMSERLFQGDHVRTIHSIVRLAEVVQARGRFPESESLYRQALVHQRRAQEPDNADALAILSLLGEVLRDQGKADEAESCFREAVAGLQLMAEDEPRNTLLATINLGSLLQTQGEPAEACELLGPVEAAARKAFSGTRVVRMGRFLTALGRARSALGEFESAEANLTEAYSMLAESKAANDKDRQDVVDGLIQLFAARHAAAPDAGYDHAAAEWRERLHQTSSGP